MFVDELKIYAAAGDGGDGVVRWHQDKFKPRGGPAGGNGGNGGSVYMRAIKDLNQLAKYTGKKEFRAESGTSGTKRSMHGKNGEDFYIDVPVGSTVTDIERERVFELTEAGETVRVLKGGQGGLGNEHFKSSTNVSPEEATCGKKGESGEFLIEVDLIVDVGLVGLPNAGKSTLLNKLTNASSKIGAYPFTTLEPHLGELYGYILADIPGLISGAAKGKGLGHKFLRHVSRTKMLFHVISLTVEDIEKSYYTILDELKSFDSSLLNKEQWIVLTKKDLVNQSVVDDARKVLEKYNNHVLVVGEQSPESYKKLSDSLVQHLRESYNTHTTSDVDEN